MFRRRFPTCYQRDAIDCGAACLQSIAKYYGKNINLERLREKTYITNEGTSMRGLQLAAKEINFEAKAYKLTLSALKIKFDSPMILYWGQNHYVVLYNIKKSKKGNYRFYIADPMAGKVILDEELFQKTWAQSIQRDEKLYGFILTLSTKSEFFEMKNDKTPNYNFSKILSYIKPYKRTVCFVFYCIFLANILQFALPFSTQIIVDKGISNKSVNIITLILIAQIVIYFSSALFDFIRRFLLLHVNSRVNITMISDFLLKLTNLPIRFFDNKLLGDILQRINDHSKIESFLTSNLTNIIFSISTFVIFSAVLSIYSYKIVLLFFIGSTLYYVWILFFMERRRQIDYSKFIQQSISSSSLVEFIEGMKDIKLYNCQNQKRWEWEKIQVRIMRLNIDSLSNEQYQTIGSIFINQIKNALISFLCAKMVIESSLSLGMLLSIQFIVGQLEGPISQSIDFIHSWQDAKISFERMGEIHVMENEEKVDQIALDNCSKYNIDIENVSFQYGGPFSQFVLNGINLHIPYGKTTAIVGSSGSGKTTLVKLLLGFYTPTKGDIRIGNYSLKSINLLSWRSRCGVILQDSYIFSDTIAKNIALGNDMDIDYDRLIYSIEMSNLKQLIEKLPLKYETRIGADGHGLSKGQQQRVLIARAIYKQPDYIFLDEATNSLDASNENEIMDNINVFGRNKTSIIIAHRFSTIKNADQIIVLDNGRIVEQGNHYSLLEVEGVYYNLMREQIYLNDNL